MDSSFSLVLLFLLIVIARALLLFARPLHRPQGQVSNPRITYEIASPPKTKSGGSQ